MEVSDTGFFSRLRDGLGKTRSHLIGGVKHIFTGNDPVSDQMFDALEESLISADIGVATTAQIIDDMRARAKADKIVEPQRLYQTLKDEMIVMFGAEQPALHWQCEESPHIMLVAGVNGSGKTTTAGKIAFKLANSGRKVLLGAADTFRAAATEQLAVWAKRANADIIHHKEGADPGAVAYDSVDAAIARKCDNVIIDTAGRLHTKVNLMEELKKVQRVIGKRLPGAPHEVLLALDATTGQNGLQQAKQFTDALAVTGIVLTKLDGTAKGGMAVAIYKQLGIPIKLIGVGEGVDDLQPFDARQFVDALFD
ncbi:MAG TPA: signal recognition particle-docking protein FtsY [Candidatus Hydrogenedentes bacterium]|nr:signal recognition particle-docking protein FtsY [Candidatus Hydrogenedentota bacterium]